jgi:hypothetical protein
MPCPEPKYRTELTPEQVTNLRQNEKVIPQYLAKQGQEVTLDPDVTSIEANKQEVQWTYKNIRGYQAMLAYINKVCVR